MDIFLTDKILEDNKVYLTINSRYTLPIHSLFLPTRSQVLPFYKLNVLYFILYLIYK